MILERFTPFHEEGRPAYHSMPHTVFSIRVVHHPATKLHCMKTVVRILAGASLVALFLFCTFGFLASFEPNPPKQQWIWRAIFTSIGLGSLLGLFHTCRPAGKAIAIVAVALLFASAAVFALALSLSAGARHGAPR